MAGYVRRMSDVCRVTDTSAPPQLILYWYGIPHPETGLNLATCIWQSRAHAIAANSKPHHVRAMRLAAASYERYELARYRLIKSRGEQELRVEPYDRGDVGW